MHKLIVLRGNSGSGKTTVAKALQQKLGENTMLISQDMIRREILKVSDGADTKVLPLLKELLRYGSRHSDVAILEGIMFSEWYRPLFELAAELYGREIYAYYFDIPFEETLRRHSTRAKSSEFGEKEMRSWWVDKDYTPVFKEVIISADMDKDSIVQRIFEKVS